MMIPFHSDTGCLSFQERGLRSLVLRAASWMLTVMAAATLAGCGRTDTVIKGTTMGTTYMVKVSAGRLERTGHLKSVIDQRLDAINASMSTFIPGSEISRFNAMPANAQPFQPSADFLSVMRTASRIHTLSGGAWDGTVDPLVNLWGFGRIKTKGRIPEPSEIKKVLPQVGFGLITLTEQGRLVKTVPAMTLDLASIAKGYGVDQVARLLKQQGFTDFLVEIGGEVVASGQRPGGKPWRVGINSPNPKAGTQDVYKIANLSDTALATSGDYRNFLRSGEQRLSHILDPRTGYPVRNGVISVSVKAESCALADGLATALMVMGAEKGIALAESLPDVEALIIVNRGDGTLSEYATPWFATLEKPAKDSG